MGVRLSTECASATRVGIDHERVRGERAGHPGEGGRGPTLDPGLDRHENVEPRGPDGRGTSAGAVASGSRGARPTVLPVALAAALPYDLTP